MEHRTRNRKPEEARALCARASSPRSLPPVPCSVLRVPSPRGFTLIYLLVIIFVFSLMMLPVINFVAGAVRVLVATIDREQSLQIAETGINYYQWHLAHFPSDYKDGTNATGPYTHNYVDFDTQETIGQFTLTITPPLAGSTIVTIRSEGATTRNPNITRSITARYGIPSLAKFSFLSNDVIWIGDMETVSGELQSNNGVRFDGVGNAPIGSAKSTYTCPTSQGNPCPTTKNGVWGNADQSVKNFWQFPVPAVDFSSLTSDLASIKSNAQSGGMYLPPSNAQGYSLVFNAAGTVSVYKVTNLKGNLPGWDVNGVAHNEFTDYNNRSLQFTQAIPANGIIYVEDKVWVEGTVNGRATVAAALLPYNPATAPTIYIPDNIIYAAKDGTNVLGLIAQKDVVVTSHSSNDIEIDAAMISQNGSVEIFHHTGNVKNSITIFGSIMSFGQWTWSYVTPLGLIASGYQTTNDVYDSNLLYAPPPSFPLSSSGYQIISWLSD
ncbi:MAG: pilus assembly PilX N-terminal domain-containing protein [Patescibacteria group bacterium]